MRHLWRWICGYLHICLQGKQINRFLNLCSKNRIPLWHITYDLERKVRAYIHLKDFYSLKTYLKKTRTRLRIIEKIGFPFWCFRHPRLKWMFLVCVLFFVLSIYSLSYVWEIQISGNENISSIELLQCLEENNIVVGKKLNEIDCTNVEFILRREFQNMGWVSVYVDRTCLCIDIKESLYDKFDDYPIKDGKGYHLAANKDAYIDSIITQNGTPLVTEGMQVKKGDILILGQCEILDDIGEVKTILNVQAKALIYGDVVYDFVVPLNEMEIMSLRLAGTYNNDMLLSIANHKICSYIEKLQENGVIILNKNVMIDKKDNMIAIIGRVYAREQIGKNIPVEEVGEYEFE